MITARTILRLHEDVGAEMVFHGTTAQHGKAIQAEGVLKPRGGAPGNWSGGTFGGNPSHPDLVYVTLNEQAARDYAQEVCRRAHTPAAALVTARPEWEYAVPDEDAVFEILNTSAPTASSLAAKLWMAYSELMGYSDGDEAYEIWHHPPDDQDPPLDSELAGQMKDLVQRLPAVLTTDEMHHLTRQSGTVAFSRPLHVVNVEYFLVAGG